MRPVKLAMEGINSFSERVEIDFEPLLRAGLFGIFGDTGSGKSTILDAVVLALYGETDRTNRIYECINARCDRASVDFTFETEEEGERRLYEIERTFLLGKNRAYKGSEARLSRVVDGVRYPVADKAREADEKLRDLIGLTREDFRKCIALPQGEFSSFVKATRADRLEIVGRLFSLEKYSSVIFGRVKALEERLRSECDGLEGQRKAMEAYTAEGLAEAEAALKLAEEEMNAAKRAAEAAEEAYRAAEAGARSAEEARKTEEKRDAELLRAKKAKERVDAANATSKALARDDEAFAEAYKAALERKAAIESAEGYRTAFLAKKREIEEMRRQYAEAKRSADELEKAAGAADARLGEIAARRKELKGEVEGAAAEAVRSEIRGEVSAAHGRVKPLADGSAYALASEREWAALEEGLRRRGQSGLGGGTAALEEDEKLAAEEEALSAKRKRDGEKRAAAQAKAEELLGKGKQLREEADEARRVLSEKIGGEDYAAALEGAKRAALELEKKKEERKRAAGVAERELRDAMGELSAAEAAAKTLAAEAEKLKEASRGALSPEKWREVAAARKEKADISAEKTKTFGGLTESTKKYKQILAEKCIIEERLSARGAERDLAERLRSLVSNKKLMEFVAEESLAEIAGSASSILIELTGGRYYLVYEKEFLVGDNYDGGNRRAVTTLSGGEIFLVSLSLAVALSTAICSRSSRPVEFFFLDEGFGTLDETLVEVVLDSLEKLRSTHFPIGLISHVAELKQRIGAKILVMGATADRGSRLEIVC